MGIEVLGELRHVCHESGGCCQGNTAMLSAGEAEEVTKMAGAVGVETPVVAV